jgi:predicted  nucleic acid-binding Zn-ribbon protein
MDEARTLLELQDLDLRIFRLNKRLDEMPEKRQILAMRSKLAEVKGLLGRTEAAGRAVDVRLKHLEDDDKAIIAKMETEQAKLLSGEVKVPKELQAISMELDGLKRRRDAVEDEEFAEMAKREAASEQETKVRTVLEAGARKEAELVAAFKTRGGGLLAEMEELKKRREALASKVQPPVLSRYEALRQSKHGIAIGSLDGDMCGACRVTLPGEQVEKLLAGPPIGVCPKCQRMVVVGEER